MLLGFKPDFVEPIQAGTKEFTLRTRTANRRRHPPKIGDTLHMYTGMCTKWCRLISKAHKLQHTQNVRIMITRHRHDKTGGELGLFIEIMVDGRLLTPVEIIEFARRDGFTDASDFAEYWLNGKSRTGAFVVMYCWKGKKY